MERIENIKIFNKIRIKQIISSNRSLKQKKIDLSFIKTCYIREYCLEENKSITFTCGLVKNVQLIRFRMVKDNFIDVALNDFVFHRDEENPSFLDQLDLCFERGYIEIDDKMINNYRLKDLNEMLNRRITSVSLFLENEDYLLDSSPTAIILRNFCIMKKLLSKNEFKKLRSPSYYESILGFKTHIKRDVQTYFHLYAMGNGYNDKKISCFEFLGMQEYPYTLRKLFKMNENYNDKGLNLIDIYNANFEKCYKWVVDNILDIERFPYGHSKFSFTLHEYILKIHNPDLLEEIKYMGRYDDHEVIALAVESLGI